MRPDKFTAIHSLVGGAISSQSDGSMHYHDGQTPPSEAEIDAEVVRLQTEYDAQAYARSRKVEYDALNQFELISDDTKNGTTTHIDAIDAIKAKYPKPE
jgi:hypothetical protein